MRPRRAATSLAPAHPPVSPAASDAEARFDFFERARHYTDYLGVETERGAFVVAASDRGVGRSLFVKRARPEFKALRHAVTVIEILSGEDAIAGRTFVDVGANIGTSTVAALVAHRFGSAVSCEPEEESYRLLRANLALNGVEAHTRPLRVAVSNRLGSSSFVVTQGRRGASWIATDPGKVQSAEAVRAKRIAEDPGVLADPRARAPGELAEITVVDVELVTLDRLVSDGLIAPDRAGMVWIDTEGHEGHILEGAQSLTDRGAPIVFEFNPGGLDERGDRAKVHEVVECCYTHFVDVRRPEPDRAQPRFRPRAVTELPAYAERFLDPSRPGHTDLLLLRLDAGQARVAAELPELVRQRLFEGVRGRTALPAPGG